MNGSRVALALALALCLFPLGSTVAFANDPDPEVSSEPAEATATPRDIWDRMLAFEITGGIDTPYGLVGGAVVVSPIRYLALDLGGGVSRDGGRVAGGARLVLPHANGAFGVRVGFAGGPLTWTSHSPDQTAAGRTDGGSPPLVAQTRSWDFVGFLDAAISLEIRFDMGIYTRVELGVEHALAGPDRCVEPGVAAMCSPGGAPTRSYLGLAVGYALDI